MTREPAPQTKPQSEPVHCSVWLGLTVSAVVLVWFRLHAFALPLETDECNYAYIAARMLEGSRLYVDVWDHQPYGVFVLFAVLIKFFGDAPEVFRYLSMASSLLSLGLIFLILRRVSCGSIAVVGAMLFAIVSSDPGTAGEGCNREIYMNTLILLSWYLAIGRRTGLALLGAGVALALGSAIKTVVAVHWFVLATWITLTVWRSGKPRRALTSALLLGAGPLVLWLASFLYFWADGRVDAFVDAVFLFNLGYSDSAQGALSRVTTFLSPPINPFRSAIPLWIAGGAGTAFLLIRSVIRRGTRADEVDPGLPMALLALASFVAIVLPGRFWPHYYYLLIAPLVLVVSFCLCLFREFVHQRCSPEQSSAGVYTLVVCFALVGGATLWTQYRDYLSQDPLGITFERYKTRDFLGRALGERIRSVTEADDTIFVYSNDASIYYYSQRRCASRYTMITGISEGMVGAERRRRILMEELIAARPRLIVVLFDEKPFAEWRAFLQESYGEPIGWDFHDDTNEPILFILARKDRPVRTVDWNWDRSMISAPGRLD